MLWLVVESLNSSCNPRKLRAGLETAKAVIFVKDAAVTLPLAQGIVENVGVMAEAYYAQRRDCAKILDDFRSGTVQASGIQWPERNGNMSHSWKESKLGCPKTPWLHCFIIIFPIKIVINWGIPKFETNPTWFGGFYNDLSTMRVPPNHPFE